MKNLSKKSLAFLFGAVILVLVLFYFVSYGNIEGMLPKYLQQNLDYLQSDLENAKNSGDPNENWKIIQDDFNYIADDLDYSPSKSVSDQGNYGSVGSGNGLKTVPMNTTSSLTKAAAPANTTVPTITTAALTTPALTTKPAVTTAALTTPALTTTPVVTTPALTTKPMLTTPGMRPPQPQPPLIRR